MAIAWSQVSYDAFHTTVAYEFFLDLINQELRGLAPGEARRVVLEGKYLVIDLTPIGGSLWRLTLANPNRDLQRQITEGSFVPLKWNDIIAVEEGHPHGFS